MAKPNPRNANGAARRKVRAAVLAEESDCWICGKPVDKSLTWAWGQHGPRCKGDGCASCVPHPMCAEVDEIIPVSQGGSPIDRDNCRLAHRTCNRERTQPTPPADANPNLFPISGCWSGLFQ